MKTIFITFLTLGAMLTPIGINRYFGCDDGLMRSDPRRDSLAKFMLFGGILFLFLGFSIMIAYALL